MSSVPLRTVFVVNALLFLPAGLLIYFLPLASFGVSPLWLARVAGAVIVAWAAALIAGAVRPTGGAVVQMVTGNLLVTATLVPAALRAGLPGPLRSVFLGVSAVLFVLAVLGLLLSGRTRGSV
ncbi:hypothetical protein Q0M94_09660 [Deinococcus radiomollis]|uniref:hypothetical protein n=1 Tax=Deinococcus radiomollis TaxID=468916 RepID=UPI003891FBFD